MAIITSIKLVIRSNWNAESNRYKLVAIKRNSSRISNRETMNIYNAVRSSVRVDVVPILMKRLLMSRKNSSLGKSSLAVVARVRFPKSWSLLYRITRKRGSEALVHAGRRDGEDWTSGARFWNKEYNVLHIRIGRGAASLYTLETKRMVKETPMRRTIQIRMLDTKIFQLRIDRSDSPIICGKKKNNAYTWHRS